jgi:hypothetical protein
VLDAPFRIARDRAFLHFDHDNVTGAQLLTGCGIDRRFAASQAQIDIADRVIRPADAILAVDEVVAEFLGCRALFRRRVGF